MAIATKGTAPGVATETSGAALSPTCPAVVDAGDILLAHVFWEGTTSAPATPDGWTLLHGPALIETTVARHWVFGRIADGTEDGAAVAFGAPAVTTQRAARIYSLSGRVSGTITDLVRGFVETSHATDPQMPTVTTTVAGALAVTFIAQNDNNAFGAATGETGGDWTEPLVEFSANLTPGLTIGVQTATPTDDPGTITGGAIATTNDPCGVIGFEVRPSLPVITGTGVLASAAASADGAGVSSSTGTGELSAQAAQVDGAGVSGSTGTGALEAAAAAVEGSGTSGSTGTGELSAGGALVSGEGEVTGSGEPEPVVVERPARDGGGSIWIGSGQEVKKLAQAMREDQEILATLASVATILR